MADGYGFGGEGDWKTSVLLRALKVMAGERAGGTSFMEDYTYHFGPGEPKILGAHMLEVCPSIALGKPGARSIPLSIGGREDPVRLVFDAAPAKGFVVGLVDLGDRFRLVANEIEVVPPDAPLPKLPVARAVWKPAPSLSTSAESWLSAGGPHHTVLSTALISRLSGLRSDHRGRAGPYRRVDDHRKLPAGAPLEPGVLPPGAWPRPRVTGSSGANLACRGSQVGGASLAPLMQKLINDPKDFVDEVLQGILKAHGDDLKLAGGPRGIVRADAPVKGKVAIVTGGGSGHLPVFMGYVGRGFADGAAIGNVFASPSAEQMLSVVKAVDGGRGVLFLYGNYGGDVLNFGLAAELAEAEGIRTETVTAADDIASAPKGDESRRRGIAGIFFLYKVAGASARGGERPRHREGGDRARCREPPQLWRRFGSLHHPCGRPPQL